ncbi:hypothetical protein GBM95_11705 [Sutterella seckii]|uniref:Uncharacterized protein n=1 Tax=Sutterella seckii TaxID=1944635 RepID=A0A6I1EIA0_9BURK|nr:hypothetical protein [Sutterella seckii]KAB7651004.1 hypothetical protein GBM95_11705 [Sutterella seckii]
MGDRGAPAALIGVTLLFGFCTVASSWIMAKVSQAVLITLRTELYDRIMTWPAERYQTENLALGLGITTVERKQVVEIL